MKLLQILVFVMFPAIVFAQPTFENKKGGYKISIPFKWTVKQEDDVTIVYAPDEGDMDVWKEKLEISLTTANDLDLEEGFKFYIEQDLPAIYNGIQVLKQGEENINGLKTKWMVFSFSQSSNVFHNLFYLVWRDKKFYMLQAAAEKSFYPKYESEYLKIIRSFQFVK
ncbi:MAG TPA: hypothetical protein VFU05_18990 [Cyclobacteriaceae bacterium]|nr:hypothetical protein [Cyclobacteriaceae bacterium]